MGDLTFILGGARSGKSRHAQDLAAGVAGDRTALYVATGQPSDDQMAARIGRYRQDRQRRAAVRNGLTLFITNHLLRHGDATHCAAEQGDVAGTERAVAERVQTNREVRPPTILVSNEAGSGLVPTTPLGRVFRDVAGRANQQVASEADRAGIAVHHAEEAA